jgi:hypothetical protein
MSEETIQLIAAAVVALCQVYMVEPWKFPVFAYFWDLIAKACAHLSNSLAWWSVQARSNYFAAVAAYGN